MAYNKSYQKPANVLVKYGLTHEGNVYPVLGDTYPIKDELKAAGAYFTRGLGWFFADSVKAQECGHEFVTLQVSDVVRYVGPGRFDFIYEDELKKIVDKFQPKVEQEVLGTEDSTFLGTVGGELTVEVTIRKVFAFNGRYGESYMFVMEDANGNICVWNTKSRDAEDFPEGTSWTVTGKVKEHKVYNGINQTVMNYCKMSQ